MTDQEYACWVEDDGAQIFEALGVYRLRLTDRSSALYMLDKNDNLWRCVISSTESHVVLLGWLNMALCLNECDELIDRINKGLEVALGKTTTGESVQEALNLLPDDYGSEKIH